MMPVICMNFASVLLGLLVTMYSVEDRGVIVISFFLRKEELEPESRISWEKVEEMKKCLQAYSKARDTSLS